MLKFCEKTIKAKSEAVLALKPEIDAAVDKLCSDGYDNLFLVGIGGTYASGMEIEAYMRGHSKIKVYLENAADLPALGHSELTERSLVLITSVTGNTPEVVAAVDYVHERGAKVIGFIDEKNVPLALKSDILFSAPGDSYFKMLLFVLRLSNCPCPFSTSRSIIEYSFIPTVHIRNAAERMYLHYLCPKS